MNNQLKNLPKCIRTDEQTLNWQNCYLLVKFLYYNPTKKMRSIFIAIFTVLMLTQVVISVQKDYTDFVKNLKQKITESPFKGSAYNRLAFITDAYGPRMWGSSVLEQVIYKMMSFAQQEQFQNIKLESVSNFTKWVRGKQSLTLYSPRPTPSKLPLTALGGSVSGDIQAQVLVVDTFDELEQRKNDAPGKIILFNNKWINYGSSVDYRVDGPSIAAKYGAKAMLVRSVASESVASVHTGYMEYDPKYPKIPCAAITVEDSEMFRRMQNRNQTITVRLVIETQFVPNSYSNNLVFEIRGSQKPDQIVLAGGHIDTWDTGSQTGANDDGGGFITVFQALRMLKRLGLRPRRTLRFIAWSGEQSGSQRDGAAQYLQRHLNEIDKHVAAFQSDLGSTKLIGFGHSGSGQAVVQQVLTKYLSILGAQKYQNNGQSSDVEPLAQKGVPIFKNLIQDTPDHAFYFKYHHTAGDSMTMMNTDDLDSNVVGFAAFLYIIADLQTSVRAMPSNNKNLITQN